MQTTERFLRHGLSLIAFTMLALGATAPTSAAIRPITGDWDGDGSTNVAFWNDSIRRALFDVNEDGRIDGVSPDLGNPGDIALAGDWDGDGRDTLALYRPSTGRLYVFSSNTRVVAATQSAVLGAPEDIPLRGDWDGDGRDGFALYRPSTRQFTFYQRVDSTTALASCNAGNPGDIPLTGDWDGNGTDGFAVYQPSTRDFWFYLIPCGAVQSHLPSIGDPGDVPIAGRWAGQSTWSVSLYRPSSSRFWLYRPGAESPFSSFAWLDGATLIDELNGRQLFYTNGAPHTDRQGQVRTSYAANSFFPRGIYGITENVFGTIAPAGFNAAMVWPNYDLDTALADAQPHGVQAVAYSFRSGGRPLVGRFAGGSTERFGTWTSANRDVWLDLNGDGNVETLRQVDPGDVPFMGDWDGDGVQTLAFYRPAIGRVYFTNDNSIANANWRVGAGTPVVAGEQPDVLLAGDWDGDGVDGFALYRPATRQFNFYQSMNETAAAFTTFDNGNVGDVPIAGDWDGDGRDGYALYRPSTREFWFYQRIDKTVTGFQASLGNPGDQPVAGDWNADGIDTIGLFRAGPWNESQAFWLHDGTTFVSSIDLGNPQLRRYDGEPGLLAWHTCDEPTGTAGFDRCGLFPAGTPGTDMTFPEILARLTDLYAAYMPLASRPLFHVNTERNPENSAIWNSFAALGDVAVADQYPLPQTPSESSPGTNFSYLAQTVSDLRTATGGTKPVWFVAQAHYYEDERFGLLQPTPAQHRAMLYTAVVHGATGLFTFMWDGWLARAARCIGIHPNPRETFGENLAANKQQRDAARDLWNSIDAQQSGVNAELAALTPDLLSSTSTAPYSITALHATTIESPIRAVLKIGPSGPVLITVNISNQPVEAIVQLQGSEPQAVLLPFESRTLAAPLGGIRDVWPAWGVHVYRWP